MIANYCSDSPQTFDTRCHCTEYYKYSRISPSIISGSKFKIPSQYFMVNFGITNLYQLLFIFFCACTAVQIVSFKNPPANYCCFGTSTVSPWAKATFLHMYLFFSVPSTKILWRKNTQKNHHTIIQWKQHST